MELILIVVVGLFLVPLGIGLTSGRRAKTRKRTFVGRAAVVSASLAFTAFGPVILAPESGFLGLLLFIIVSSAGVGVSIAYFGFSRFVEWPVALCLLAILPMAGPLSFQWWRGLPQDRCAFDPVGADKVQRMKDKLAEMEGNSWFTSREGRAASIIARIEALAPPRNSTIYERLAATHLVMRVDGYVLASRPTDGPSDRVQLNAEKRDETISARQLNPWAVYSVTYIGPPYYGYFSIFQALSNSIFISMRKSDLNAEDKQYKSLQSEIRCTEVNSLTPSFKGPVSDFPVASDYSCPHMPPVEWIRAVPDRFCRTAK